MRVLFWSLTFWPNIGGVEVLAAKLLPALRERGYEFIVVAPNSHSELPDEAQYQGIPIRRFSFQNAVTPAGLAGVIEISQKVARLKRTFAPDLVHINGVGPTDFFHLTTNNAHRAPLLVTLHGEWHPEADTIVGRTLRTADWVAGCSVAVLERGLRLVPEIAARSSVIHNAVESPPFSPEPLPFGAPRILCLGRLSPEKGVDLALAAFAMIVARFPHARLIIAGDGPLKGDLQSHAVDCGIAHAVDFISWVAPKAVPSLINASTIVLLPSRRDSLPLVALEAALMGRPIVAANVGGLPEVVVHQDTGLLVEKEDTRALADAVIFLLAHPEAAVSMGQAARRRAQTIFGWKRHVEAYDTLYRRLVGENGVVRVV